LRIFFEVVYDLKERKKPVWGSVGGFYKRFTAPAARPAAEFCELFKECV